MNATSSSSSRHPIRETGKSENRKTVPGKTTRSSDEQDEMIDTIANAFERLEQRDATTRKI